MLLFPTECIVTWSDDMSSAHFVTFYDDGDVCQEFTRPADAAHKAIATCPLIMYIHKPDADLLPW
jgi:hypothetical protein